MRSTNYYPFLMLKWETPIYIGIPTTEKIYSESSRHDMHISIDLLSTGQGKPSNGLPRP